jgi:hypothetical protein
VVNGACFFAPDSHRSLPMAQGLLSLANPAKTNRFCTVQQITGCAHASLDK